MAYDWSNLLGAIDSASERREKTLLEGEEKRRRPAGVLGTAVGAEPPRQRYRPTGIASRSRRAPVSAGGTTIDALLQPAQAAPRAIIALVGALGMGSTFEMDDELRRSGGGGGGSTKGAGIDRSLARWPSAASQASAESTSRAAIAAGAQPVVIKVTSTVSSRASAAGLMSYLGTREVETENGEKGRVDIPIVDQDGMILASRDERAAALQEWVADFREAYTVNAVATLSVTPVEAIDDVVLRDALTAAFGAKPFLYCRHQDGRISVYTVTDLPAKKIAGALKARENGEGPARTLGRAEADIAGRLAQAGVLAEVCLVGAAASETSGRYFLEKFLRTEKTVTTSKGEPLKRASSVKETADGIWATWSCHIRRVEPRNAFHVIFSAKAGTDRQAMQRAVRDFLGEQVAGHRWITVHHPETGHVHVHAMISARDDVGKALRFTKPELYQWRERFAAKAREHGIAMVATRRADVAATRPYSQAQAGAYERGRADPHYLKTLSVSRRVERKRAGVVERGSLGNASLALAAKWQATTDALRKAGAAPAVIAAADRFAAAAAGKQEQRAPHSERNRASRRSSPEGVAAHEQRSAGSVHAVLTGLKQAIATVRQQNEKERAMPLSLEQFDARVSQANASMDRLERMVDSGIERQAVEAMRQEIATLFAQQRRDIERQQTRSATETAQEGRPPLSGRAEERRVQDRVAPSTADPAIVAQQQAIAAARAAHAAREQASAARAGQDEQRQRILQDAQQQRQRENDRDGTER